MDLPLKLEFSRLTHINALELLLPFVPGIVMTVGLALSSSPLVVRFGTIGLGYKMRIAVAVALTYVIGLAVTIFTQNVNYFVMRRFKTRKAENPFANYYWKRVATKFVGDDLLPDCAALSLQDLDIMARQSVSEPPLPLSNGKDASEGLIQLCNMRQSVLMLEQQMDVLQTKVNATESKSEQVTAVVNAANEHIREASIALLAHKQTVDTLNTIESKLRNVAIESQWRSLGNALQFIPTNIRHPFDAFRLIMTSMQVAAICTLCLMARYPELRDWLGCIFAVAVVLVTSYSLWKLLQLDDFFGASNSPQIAAMIREIRQRSCQK